MNDFRNVMFRVLRAQADNLARMTPGLVLEGTTAEGGPKTIVTPLPELIRLCDTPRRIMSQEKWGQLERVLTILPAVDAQDVGRIVGRDDRRLRYVISGAVGLTAAEQTADYETEQGTGQLLARKLDNLLEDVRLLVNDNDVLAIEGCDTGLVDSMVYDVNYDPGWEWPKAGFNMLVSCQTHNF